MSAGPGYLDAEGIYHYGEDDLGTGLASDLLNLAPESVSDQLVLDRARLVDLETAATARNWIPVVPTGRTLGGTGAASIDGDTGKVTLAAVQTSLIIAGALIANHDIEFEAEITLASAGTIGMNLRTGAGVDANNHDQQFTYSDNSASVGSLRIGAAGAWQMYQSSTTEHVFGGRLLHANEAAQTRLRSFELFDSTAGSATQIEGHGGGRNRNVTAYSDVKFTFSQLASGWIRFRKRAA